MMKKLIIISLIFVLFFTARSSVFADPDATPTPTTTTTPTTSVTPTPDTAVKQKEFDDLQSKIRDLEGKLTNAQQQGRTLSAQISQMDNQISLTELKMNSTQSQMKELSGDISVANKKISTLEGSLDEITKVLLKRIVATYQVGTIPQFQLMLSSSKATDLLAKANYLKLVQAHDKRLIYDTQQARNDYQNQKDIFQAKKEKVEALKTQLEAYKGQLDHQKIDKQKFLQETKGSEASYQRLLAQAQAQLAGFSRFTTSQGGSSLLGNQTVCDDWGCYYNQRDSQWGGQAMGAYSLASDGCLVTSMAMVYTHMGHRSVTPATINADSNNFASYERAWLLKTISADGMTTTRINTSIDSELSAGRPGSAGVSYDGGGWADHCLVLISGSGGNYMMNDPYTPNGHNISFRERYPNVRIVEIEKVVSQ
ncbi:hypothetical protein BH11PAT1_BH11PAT1_5360 [soil metagenome]